MVAEAKREGKRAAQVAAPARSARRKRWRPTRTLRLQRYAASGALNRRVRGRTMRAVNWFEAAAVLNLLTASIAFAYRARRKR